jgi:hypothetical protein
VEKSLEMNLVDRINSVDITKDDLWKITGDAQNFKGEPCFEVGISIINKRCDGNLHKASAIMFRMQALVNLLKTEGLPGWTLPQQSDGCFPTDEAVFAAAAVQPLIEKDNDLVFEREAFLRKILELAEPEGEG